MRPTMPGLLIAISLTLLAGASPLTAQWRAEPMVPITRAPSTTLTPPVLQLPDSLQTGPGTFTLVMAGVAGAAVGAIGGAYLGYQLDYNRFNWGCQPCDDPGLMGAVLGWFSGAALTTPPIVHLANGGRGVLAPAYLSAALIAGAGMAGLLAVGIPEGDVIFLWGAPLAQVVSAVAIEQKTAQ